MSIFKVFFQETANEVPVREWTKSVYVEGESEADVRKKLASRQYNIEFVTVLSGAHLEYEQNQEDFKTETV
ncbi:DNA-dependent RNA polymerase subunit epsilon [Alkalicoccobacillus murimartini]|uniref:DNA-directed RNA polymerase subunit epsilon n=1 Tax=Alkalicoccobacillus murimartini TaxID=171685 RepID=A0ABT9YFA9_9BACI|nr:DNA-directed RNA polymerase subunit epsilon [Alkalicoccobacillus murimartini]MDQ0206507.1 DNA-dependent RNA polymerase auxiliary subunit epsilon [Alkalicoccobacillus murimartini]